MTSRAKTHNKNWGPKFGPNDPKSDPKLGVLLLFQVWVISFHGN